MLRAAGSRLATLVVAGGCLAAVAFAGGYAVGSARAVRSPASALDQAEAALIRRADAQVSPATLTDAAIQAMVSALNDRWSSYLGPSSPQARAGIEQVLSGHYSGVGVWLSGPRLEVSGVVAGSPAARSGLVPGDQVVSVGGHAAALLGLSGALAALRGAPGTVVRLVVALPSGATRVLVLRRATLSDGAITVDTVAPGIVRIALSSFSAGVGSQVAAVVRSALAHRVQGIVLDLRGNPGGLLSEALAVASVFLDGGPVVTLTGRHQPTEVLDAARGGDVSTPLAVLVDGGTASAAEVVAAALQQRGRAVVVGSRTFGKASVQEPIALSNGGLLELTVARYQTPDGADLDAVGLVPDITVPVDAPPAEAVQTAVQVLEGLAGSVRIAPAAAVGP